MKTSFPITVGLCLAAVGACAQSAWLPAPTQFKVTPGFTFSTFDEFWTGEGKNDTALADDSLDQYTGFISTEYGILENLAADLTMGYSATDTDTVSFGPDPSDDGLTDTTFGVRYRLVNEFDAAPAMPTVSVRVGGIIAGTYDENQPFSAGDGAHGFESSLLLGKLIGQSGFGAYGDIGYRLRGNPTPDEFFSSVGVFQQLGPVTLAVGYRHVQSTSGIDLDDTDFNPALGDSHGFPALKEINQIVEGGITFTDRGGRSYQVSLGKSVDGRNTGDKWMVGANVTLPLGGP